MIFIFLNFFPLPAPRRDFCSSLAPGESRAPGEGEGESEPGGRGRRWKDFQERRPHWQQRTRGLGRDAGDPGLQRRGSGASADPARASGL